MLLKQIAAARMLVLIGLAIFVNVSYGQSVKRGVSGNSAIRANSVNSRWHYRWHYLEPPEPNYNDSEWTPMLFGAGTDQVNNNRIDYILDRQDRVNTVLGFNEPERANQGNTTVDRAIETWATVSNRFQNTGIKLVSPATSDDSSGRAWLSEFMQRADADNLTVDAVAFHWYGEVNPNNPLASANNFLARVDDYHNTYQRPVWITEFAGHDWQDRYTDDVMTQANADFLSHVIPGLESREFVEKYAWFSWGTGDDVPFPEGRLNEQDAYGLLRPTVVGRAYMPEQTLIAGETSDLLGQSKGNDHYYFQGGSLVNTGASLESESVGGIYALADDDGSARASSIGGTSDWRVNDNGFVRVEENSTLRKLGSNTIRMEGNNLAIDGQVRLVGGAANDGPLWISETRDAVGSGSFRLDPGSHLKLGSSSGTIGTSLPYDMQLRGGKVSVEGDANVLSGDWTLYETTSIDVSGDLLMSGNFVANIGGRATGIRKLGPGSLRLSGDNEFVGNVNLNDGLLAINGTTIANQIFVASDATLGGIGTAFSHVAVLGTVAPGNSAGALTVDSITFDQGSMLSIELESLASFDQLIIGQDLIIDPGATLELALLGGYQPSIGDSFQVLSFGTSTGQFGQINAPDLTSGVWDFSELYATGSIVVAVPEPSMTLFLAGILVTAVGLRQRRRTNLVLHPDSVLG